MATAATSRKNRASDGFLFAVSKLVATMLESRTMEKLAVYLLFGFAISSAAQTAGSGSICGTVLDENGQPAKNIRVTAVYLGAHTGPYPASRSDDSGHYCLGNVPYGDNAPAADDPAHGYPNTQYGFYASGTDKKEALNIAHLRNEHPTATVDLRIPYKAAFLTIHLTDAITGKTQLALFYKLSAQTDPQRRYTFGSRSATDALLLPPNENVLLKVSAPGYREWPYDGSPGYILNLVPGERRTIDVPLQPK